MSIQALIDQANKRTAASRKKVFVKKATDSQFLSNFCAHVDIALDLYRSIPGLMDDHKFRSAMRELESFNVLTKKHLQP
ncbi:MAG: hypothetical protein ACOYL3_07215 [Desulfuromonadaceae bacterium]